MSGRKQWVPLEKLKSSEVNGYLMDQVVARFPSASARDAAFSNPEDGTLAYVTGIGLTIRANGMWQNALPANNAWTNFSLLNNWQAWGNNYAAPAYRMIANNRVELRGLAKAPAGDPTICQLPLGFRPPTNMIVIGAYQTNPPGSTRISINPSGYIYTYDANDVSINQWVSFDGISFSAA